MDACLDKTVSRVVAMMASQLGKSECANNVLGFFISEEPAPILMVQPTVEMAEAYSKERIAPMIRDTPCLAALIRETKSRDSGNTVLHKSFPGGSLAIVGSNAASGLAGRPRRVVLLDEVDRFPPSAGTEGDPCELAIRRTESFWNAVVMLTSTPTIKGLSRIENEWEQSDQRRWFCPCPRCGHSQWLKWPQVTWPEGKPQEARYRCEGCEELLDDRERRAMVLQGEWRPTAEFTGVVGFHINGLNSPFPHKRSFNGRLHQAAQEFLAAKRGGREKLKTWVNTFLAETWEEAGDQVEAEPLYKRREAYGPKVNNKVVIITAGVDVQREWMEVEIVGWSTDEESWGIKHVRIPGTSAAPATWNALDRELLAEFEREDGVKLRVACALVDSGEATAEVYKFTRPRQPRGVYACKGVGGYAVPLCGRFSTGNRARAMLFPVGTDTAKELIYSRLNLVDRGPGYMHFPMEYDLEYFNQLTAEKRISTRIQGKRVIKWEKIRDRNEALDLRVYATAALAARNADLATLERRLIAKNQPANEAESTQETPQIQPETEEKPWNKPRLRPKTGGYVSKWKRW